MAEDLDGLCGRRLGLAAAKAHIQGREAQAIPGCQGRQELARVGFMICEPEPLEELSVIVRSVNHIGNGRQDSPLTWLPQKHQLSASSKQPKVCVCTRSSTAKGFISQCKTLPLEDDIRSMSSGTWPDGSVAGLQDSFLPSKVSKSLESHQGELALVADRQWRQLGD